MLFSSYVFLLLFLPLTWAGFALVRAWQGPRAGFGWLVLASLVYFGWFEPRYLLLLGFSLIFNFSAGTFVGSDRPSRARRPVLIIGVTVNLALLGIFKYANFFADTVEVLAGVHLGLPAVALPIAISFFTFQQIAYLVDAWRGLAREYRFLEYTLFVTFFPQLIAGPIVHHGEMVPQFTHPDKSRNRFEDVAVGATIFAIGLAKKVIIADSLARWADPVFAAADAGARPSAGEAWVGMLAYTGQLYFDFSGYSDMAIGIGRTFGIILPLNFHSPYKSTSITDFWRRWHMTLSRFLRDYLYIPLGGNRLGPKRRYVNLMITMLLGGLWHGAGWNFVVWGGLHGLYLIVNHFWAAVRDRVPLVAGWTGPSRTLCAGALTFAAASLAWIPFRATTFAGAWNMSCGLVHSSTAPVTDVSSTAVLPWVILALAITWVAPNTQQILAARAPALEYRDAGARWPANERPKLALRWRPSPAWALGTSVLFLAALAQIARGTTFIYFQF